MKDALVGRRPKQTASERAAEANYNQTQESAWLFLAAWGSGNLEFGAGKLFLLASSIVMGEMDAFGRSEAICLVSC